MARNWIVIWDNTQQAKILYASENITAITGWEADEVIGKSGFELFHSEDLKSLEKVHLLNVYNEKISSMVSYRHLTKDGSYVQVETIIHYCHDVLVGTNFLYEPDSIGHKQRANTVDDVYACLPEGKLLAVNIWNSRSKTIKGDLTREKIWVGNHIVLAQEHRFCLLLNRFTEELNIVFASAFASELVSLDINKAIGEPLFNYISDKYVDSVLLQINIARETEMLSRLRFDWIVDREKGISEPVEAIIDCCEDGVVMIVRLAPRLFTC